MKYERIVSEVYRKPWAILPGKLHAIAELIALRASGQVLTAEEIKERIGIQAARNGAQSYGVVAVIPIYGVISQRVNLMNQISGGTSIEKLTASFRQALADPGVKAIVFDVDSPGGTVEGVPELSSEIYNSRSKKKSVAIANPMAASAAYWLASSAGELVVLPSGQVGSIGVFAEHDDISKALEAEGVKVSLISAGKFKTDGNPYEPLSDEARADLQSKVDSFYEMFVKAVARGRGVSQATVREGFGQGRMVLADDAVKQRMADRVATFDQAIARLGGDAPPRRISVSSANDPENGDPDLDGDEPECECECEACHTEACDVCTASLCLDPACGEAGCPASRCPRQSSGSKAGTARP